MPAAREAAERGMSRMDAVLYQFYAKTVAVVCESRGTSRSKPGEPHSVRGGSTAGSAGLRNSHGSMNNSVADGRRNKWVRARRYVLTNSFRSSSMNTRRTGQPCGHGVLFHLPHKLCLHSL